jgi:hypothetical protein
MKLGKMEHFPAKEELAGRTVAEAAHPVRQPCQIIGRIRRPRPQRAEESSSAISWTTLPGSIDELNWEWSAMFNGIIDGS